MFRSAIVRKAGIYDEFMRYWVIERRIHSYAAQIKIRDGRPDSIEDIKPELWDSLGVNDVRETLERAYRFTEAENARAPEAMIEPIRNLLARCERDLDAFEAREDF